MFRVLVAHRGALARGALAFVLQTEADIKVVAEVGRFEELTGVVLLHRPDVTVVDADLLPADDLSWWRGLDRHLPVGNMLVLTDARRSSALAPVLAESSPRLGFLTKDGPPQRLVAAVRAAASSESVLDPELVVAAVQASSPLTPRETQVLRVAAEGAPVAEIAARLVLAPGTIRNHLSRIIGKVGARTRIEAVNRAQDAGWI